MMARASWSITWSVWRAMFLREALHRLFHRRAAWLWLLLEPIAHIAFLMFIFTVLRMHVVGGMETALWLMLGLLGFFMFKRTVMFAMGAVAMAKPLLAYRQVKPVDAVLVRAATEGLLMLAISIVLLLAAFLFGLPVWPDDPLAVLAALLGLWLLGLGGGLMFSVPRELVPETGEVVNVVMTPVYFLSGVMFPLAVVPEPYRSGLMLNPVAHSVEALRMGFAAHYTPVPELSLAYPPAFALVTIFLGLALHRVYQRRLVQQ